MIYVYSPKNYVGLDGLLACLGAARLHRFDGEDFWDKARRMKLRLEAGSFIVAWGTTLPELEGFKVLNSKDFPMTRYEQLVQLTIAKVRHIDVYEKPISSLEAGDSYVCRQNGKKIDLSRGPFFGDYYTGKHVFTKEFSVHSFLSKALRSGEKIAIGPNSHPWIRNENHGWLIDYTVPSTPELRSIAHKAVKALGLSFGVVDVGLSTSGALMVLGVSLAPELTNPTIIKGYANSIKKWVSSFEVEAPDAIL